MKHDISYNRYHRQLRLHELGEEGQRKLLAGRVLVVGAGGLGCPALLYLAGAGVGCIGILDDDHVSLDNLHRQILYNTSDIGKVKSIAAKTALDALNPDIQIIAYPDRLTTTNCIDLFEAFDIIIDGTDNFATRYLVNDACVITGKPLVFGAVSRFEGQVAIFNSEDEKGTPPVNYRDLFPDPPKDGEVLNCAETGVLGVLPGIIGTLQASETIKLFTGIGVPLINKMLTLDLLQNNFLEIELAHSRNSKQKIPASREAFEKTDYNWLCSNYAGVNEIGSTGFKNLLINEEVTVIDVREEGELPLAQDFEHQRIPLSELSKHIDSLNNDTPVVFFCQAGSRSKQAAFMLGKLRSDNSKIFSLAGGIEQWIFNKKHGSHV